MYVNKRIKKIKSFLFFFSVLINGTSKSILPASTISSFLIISPLLLIIALIPLLVDLIRKEFCSIALNTPLTKC